MSAAAAKVAERIPAYASGAHVRVRKVDSPGHIRTPHYIRGKTGTIERIHGCHAYPDAVASGKGDDPQWLYTVVFQAHDLWGPQADPTVSVSVDAWESYLEPEVNA